MQPQAESVTYEFLLTRYRPGYEMAGHLADTESLMKWMTYAFSAATIIAVFLPFFLGNDPVNLGAFVFFGGVILFGFIGRCFGVASKFLLLKLDLAVFSAPGLSERERIQVLESVRRPRH